MSAPTYISAHMIIQGYRSDSALIPITLSLFFVHSPMLLIIIFIQASNNTRTSPYKVYTRNRTCSCSQLLSRNPYLSEIGAGGVTPPAHRAAMTGRL